MDEQSRAEAQSLDSYATLAKGMMRLNDMYGGMPFEDVYSAFVGAGGANMLAAWPNLQNRRVRSINTKPAKYSKDAIEEMVGNPEGNEKALRSISASLSHSTKTYDLIIQTYPNIMTYDWYISIGYSRNTPGKERQMREYALAYQIAETMDVKAKAREINGLCQKYGKVFYTPRISLDKAHGKVNYAFLQQLPEDWCKIVGFNNGPGRYTVAFNLMYFLWPGNDWRQFGDLFAPYMPHFYDVVETKSKTVYAAKINTEKFKKLEISDTPGHPKWELVGGQWMYWVTLPADRVITFEADDRTPLVAPPNTGLMVSMTQIPNYEAAQMEIILNPLTSVLTGTLETTDSKTASNSEPILVSPSTRKLFETLWYDMLAKNNTCGIGLYLAPAKDLKLQTLSDTVSNTDISSSAYADQVEKAGLPALIPTTDDPKVGVAQLSAGMHARYSMPIYWGFERMMNWIFENLGFKSRLRFHMFGNIFDREKDLENARKGMTLGILPDTLRYDAMMGISPLEDIATSAFISDSGLLDMRKPLVSSYSAKQETGTLPPQAKKDINPGGRPPEEGSINSEVTENTGKGG